MSPDKLFTALAEGEALYPENSLNQFELNELASMTGLTELSNYNPNMTALELAILATIEHAQETIEEVVPLPLDQQPGVMDEIEWLNLQNLSR